MQTPPARQRPGVQEKSAIRAKGAVQIVGGFVLSICALAVLLWLGAGGGEKPVGMVILLAAAMGLMPKGALELITGRRWSELPSALRGVVLAIGGLAFGVAVLVALFWYLSTTK